MKHLKFYVPVIIASMSISCQADQIVKIGHVAPLTGGLAHLGKELENGAQLAVEEINAKGLFVGGERITLVLDNQDDGGDPRQGTQVAQKMIDDGVVAVVGHLNSGVNIPASRLYNDAGITNITPAATNPQLTLQGFKVTYRVVGTDAQQGPALARYAHSSMAIKTVAVVDDSTAYGQGLANEFEKTAATLGIKVVSHDATNDKATDFKAVLTKIKGERPDAIMYGGMDATGGPFARQARALGINAKVLLGDGACTGNLVDLAGAATDSVVCSEAGLALERMPRGQEFAKKYEARFKRPIELYAPYSYDAVYVIVDAMKRANSVKASAILAAMPKTDYNGIIGKIEFDSKGDLAHPTISLYDYKSGQKSLLDVVKM
ncbi:branched-chain amino acid ABC transporter substrate-binding protein [Paraburkholderia sp.]|uniref:branched-chain amino acid ABC transporter substrate-binding protein n=1 Tax=Paraburkholderia sp. TaxID=1926495 RepID=UPI003D6F453A